MVSTAVALRVPGRLRTRMAGLLVLALLSGGCAHTPPGPPDGLLVGRILAPPGVGDAPAPSSVSAPAPSETAAPASRVPKLSLEELPPEKAEPQPASLPDPRLCTKTIGLEEAIDLAFRNQPRLRVYQARVEEAQGRGQAAFAPFLPRVNLLMQEFFAHNPDGPLSAVAVPAPEFGDAPGYMNYALAELLMQWTLWDFGRTYGRYQQAELNIDIAQLQATRTAQTVVYDVSATYYRVLQAQAARKVAQEAVRLAESVLNISRKSLKAGLLESDQVLRSEVQLAQARRTLVLAERAERVAVAALNQAIGLNVSSPTEVIDRTEEPPFGLSLAECLQRAVDSRREFQIARRSIEVAQEGVRVNRAEFAPRIFVQGALAGEDGHKVRHGATESATINIAWGVLEGGQRLGDLRTAGASVRAAVAQAQVVCDTIAFEVNEAFQDIGAARQSIDLARPAVSQARENLRLVTRKYENGDATPTDIVDAETSLTRAAQDLYTAQYGYLTALARIDYAMGVTPWLPSSCGK
jgi:outer membrane protein